MVEVTVSDKIYLNFENPDDHLLKSIKKVCTLTNPLYYKLMKMGNKRALRGCKKEFKYYKEPKPGQLIVYRGLEERIKQYCGKRFDEGYNPTIEVCSTKSKAKFKGEIELRDYQQEPYLQTMFQPFNMGIMRLDTGFGKTVMSAKLVHDLGLTALVVVPRGHLLNQFKDTFKDFLGYETGVIQGTTVDIKPVTIATIQTLQSKSNLVNEIRDKFGVLIVDECHTMVTDKRLDILTSLKPKHIYGLTATPRREDGKTEAIHFAFGEILCDFDLPREKPDVEIFRTHFNIPLDEYADMVAEQVEHEGRNTMIANKVIENIEDGRRVLVLTKRVGHYNNIASKLSKYKVIKVESKDGSDLRAKTIERLRSQSIDFNVILGTYSMLSTGFDVPMLDTVIFAGDLKSTVLTEQSSGRILRLFSKKKKPLIVDIVDNNNKIFEHQAFCRRSFYQKNEWKMYEGNIS